MTEITDKVIATAFKEQCSVVAPIGAVVTYAGNVAPSGWLLCYGQAVSRTTYAKLFVVCGTKYGAGNGSSTFNLPDLRGRRPFGKDDMGGSARGGKEINTSTYDTASITDPASTTLGGTPGGSITLNYIIRADNVLPTLASAYPAMP